jgi:hypothetical protein
MTKTIFAAAVLALTLPGAPALAKGSAAAAETSEQARIPFVDHRGIRDWHMGDDDTLYVQDRHRDWYEATLMAPIIGLGPQLAIGVDTGAIDTFDRFSTVIIEGVRYPVQSLVRIEGEPPHRGDANKANG